MVKDLSDSNLYSVTMMLFKYKRDKDVILKTWLNLWTFIVYSGCKCFHWKPKCGFAVDTGSIRNLEKAWQKENAHKYTNYDQHLYLLSYTHMQTHTSTHTPAIELRLVCAEHSTVTLAQHIKEPPQPPPAGQAVPPQHASPGPGEGVLFALSRLFWFYSQYPIAVASAELWVCCCTLWMSFWSAGKPGEVSLRDAVITICAASTELHQQLSHLTGCERDN